MAWFIIPNVLIYNKSKMAALIKQEDGDEFIWFF